MPPELPELVMDLDKIAAEITEVLDELREMSRGLHPPILAKGGLGARAEDAGTPLRDSG